MAEMLRILAIDDSPMSHKVIAKLITGRYEMESALSGAEGLEKIASFQPDLIMLDVTMPDMDGYECCQKLREIPATHNTPILFLSGRCGIEEKLKGYEVGGDDYITKPFDGEELLIKIKKHLDVKVGAEKLTVKANRAASVAVAALKDTGYIGACLTFLEASFQCTDIPSVVEHLFTATKELGWSVSLQVRYGEGDSDTFYDMSVENQLEGALMEKVCNEGLFIEFGQRVVCNIGNCSALIKNMPNDSSNNFCLMKDHLHTIMKGFHARVMYILTESQAVRQRDILSKVVNKTRLTLKETEGNFHTLMNAGAKIFDDVASEVDHVVEGLNLEEDQEKSVTDIMKGGLHKMSELHAYVLKEDQRLNKLILDLGVITSAVNKSTRMR